MRTRFRRFLQRFFRAGLKWLNPPPDLSAQNRFLNSRLDAETERNELLERAGHIDAMERVSELIEARQMAGAGPWTVSPETVRQTDDLIHAAVESLRTKRPLAHIRESMALSETTPAIGQGAYGDIELALQNVEWRREINLSWLEFSRWGIQQIILISRLNYIKNTLIQRGINVAAQYVFGRGFEVSSPDADANDTLKEFFERNSAVLGQVACTELERRKYYDGNLFFCFFTDATDEGETTVRTIDATEIQDVVTDPDDTDKPRFYRRVWSSRVFDMANGSTTTKGREAWYPALGYEPAEGERVSKIGQIEVMWDTPVLHRKCGGVAKWHFGCPLVYAALDWAKATKRYLESCLTLAASHAQIAMTLTTKGGQAALEGGKAQLSTTVSPDSTLWDQNPTPVNASIFASGPGSSLALVASRGKALDPAEAREYKLMVAMVFGLPESFFSDIKTGNLATATSLDRPTELNFLEKQECWREDFITISKFVLATSLRAPNGKLREAMERRIRKTASHELDARLKVVSISEARRTSKKGRPVCYEAAAVSDAAIEVMVNFPPIREGDVPALMGALVEAITLNGFEAGNGIDVREGVKAAMSMVAAITDTEIDVEEVTEQLYPMAKYKKLMDRTPILDAQIKQTLNPPAPAQPGVDRPDEGAPPEGAAVRKPHPKKIDASVNESLRGPLRRLLEAARRIRNRAA